MPWNPHHRPNLSQPIPLAIPLNFAEPSLRCYYSPPPTLETIRDGDFVGSVAEGGSVNHRLVALAPHGVATHTECIGHISPDPMHTVARCIRPGIYTALLLSWTFEKRQMTFLPYGAGLDGFQDTLSHLNLADLPFKALILRLMPNDLSKLTKDYSGTNPPWLDPAIGQLLAEAGVDHLVTDLPSVDAEVDGGAMAFHKAFWRFDGDKRTEASITELAFIPDTVPDGPCYLSLQPPAWHTDAVPSNPVLFPVS